MDGKTEAIRGSLLGEEEGEGDFIETSEYAKKSRHYSGKGGRKDRKKKKGRQDKKVKDSAATKRPTAWEIILDDSGKPQIGLLNESSKQDGSRETEEDGDEDKGKITVDEDTVLESEENQTSPFESDQHLSSRHGLAEAVSKRLRNQGLKKGIFTSSTSALSSSGTLGTSSDDTALRLGSETTAEEEDSSFVYTDDGEYDSSQEHIGFFGFGKQSKQDTVDEESGFKYKQYLEQNNKILKLLAERKSPAHERKGQNISSLKLPPVSSSNTFPNVVSGGVSSSNTFPNVVSGGVSSNSLNSYPASSNQQQQQFASNFSMYSERSLNSSNNLLTTATNGTPSKRKNSFDWGEFDNGDNSPDGYHFGQVSKAFSHESFGFVAQSESGLSGSQNSIHSGQSINEGVVSDSNGNSLSRSKSSLNSDMNNSLPEYEERAESHVSQSETDLMEYRSSQETSEIGGGTSRSSLVGETGDLNLLKSNLGQSSSSDALPSSTESPLSRSSRSSIRQRPHSASSLKSQSLRSSRIDNRSGSFEYGDDNLSNGEIGAMAGEANRSLSLELEDEEGEYFLREKKSSESINSSSTTSSQRRPQSAPSRRQWKKSGSFEAMMISTILELSGKMKLKCREALKLAIGKETNDSDQEGASDNEEPDNAIELQSSHTSFFQEINSLLKNMQAIEAQIDTITSLFEPNHSSHSSFSDISTKSGQQQFLSQANMSTSMKQASSSTTSLEVRKNSPGHDDGSESENSKNNNLPTKTCDSSTSTDEYSSSVSTPSQTVPIPPPKPNIKTNKKGKRTGDGGSRSPSLQNHELPTPEKVEARIDKKYNKLKKEYEGVKSTLETAKKAHTMSLNKKNLTIVEKDKEITKLRKELENAGMAISKVQSSKELAKTQHEQFALLQKALINFRESKSNQQAENTSSTSSLEDMEFTNELIERDRMFEKEYISFRPYIAFIFKAVGILELCTNSSIGTSGNQMGNEKMFDGLTTSMSWLVNQLETFHHCLVQSYLKICFYRDELRKKDDDDWGAVRVVKMLRDEQEEKQYFEIREKKIQHRRMSNTFFKCNQKG
eukprot:Nk52_evm5s242 gene=Nk52_evmTU5s242